MATAFVQSKSNTATGFPTTVAAVMTSNVGAGNLLEVGVSWGSGAQTDFVSLADTLGNTFTEASAARLDDGAGSGYQSRLYYAANISGGADTVTLTTTGNTIDIAIVVHEVSGAATTTPLDGANGQIQNNPGTGANAVSSGSFTPANNGCYIGGVTFEVTAAAAPTISAGTGYTARETATGGNYDIRSEDQIQATAAAIAATFTLSVDSAFILTMGAAFKPAAAAGWGPLLGLQNNRLVVATP